MKKPLVLCILDGWGERENTPDNAISNANLKNWNYILSKYPHTTIQASEENVGLPSGQMGNSEVGHMNIGAGRIVKQTLPRINQAFYERSVQDIPSFISLIEKLQYTGGTCHIMGLLSPGGVHSHQDHLVGLILLLSEAGIPVVVHAFLDGRDTPPQSARDYLESFLNICQSFVGVSIGTISGRYYSMDRDKRWDRTELSYNAIVNADAKHFNGVLDAIDFSYQTGITDEFVKPSVIGNYNGIKDEDAVFMFNFRSDRVRQILSSLVDPDFDFFPVKKINFCSKIGMTSYSEKLDQYFDILFPSEKIKKTLGEIISDNGMNQLRIAETEKYAHVTFFFNGGVESNYPGEDRILINSPKVSTYDLKPEMSAREVTKKLLAALDEDKYDFIVLNFANSDMLGHTGIQSAAEKAVEVVDDCIGLLKDKILSKEGTLIITADHGNAEQMIDGDKPHTAHTMNPVPFVVVSQNTPDALKETGKLADIAPTVLQLLEIKKTKLMTGESLIIDDK